MVDNLLFESYLLRRQGNGILSQAIFTTYSLTHKEVHRGSRSPPDSILCDFLGQSVLVGQQFSRLDLVMGVQRPLSLLEIKRFLNSLVRFDLFIYN